jgi:aminoglycoside phosphotransferase (APT) family kinase protein
MPVPPEVVLREVCGRVGLDARDATVLHVRANAVYLLPRDRAVARLRYAPDAAAVRERLTAAVGVTRWLHGQGFPAVEPLAFSQPVLAGDYIATFWRQVPASGAAGRDVASLARLVRRLHAFPAPAVQVPDINPLGSLRADLRGSGALPPEQRDWLLARAADLERQFAGARWALGRGLIHGDAHAGNLLHGRAGAVLGDWDSVSIGPREQDLVPTSMWPRFGRPASEWDRFCAVYGVDPAALTGLAVLRRLRELRALAAYVRRAGDPAFRGELSRRVSDLMSGTQSRPWRPL